MKSNNDNKCEFVQTIIVMKCTCILTLFKIVYIGNRNGKSFSDLFCREYTPFSF